MWPSHSFPLLLSAQVFLLKGRYKSLPPSLLQFHPACACTAAAAAPALSAGWPLSPAALWSPLQHWQLTQPPWAHTEQSPFCWQGVCSSAPACTNRAFHSSWERKGMWDLSVLVQHFPVSLLQWQRTFPSVVLLLLPPVEGRKRTGREGDGTLLWQKSSPKKQHKTSRLD